MKQRQELEKMGNRILSASRTELFLSMRFLGPALDGLDCVMDVSTRTIGTDGVSLRYHPDYVFRTWMAHPYRVNRAYVHMLIHGLFCHMYHAKDYEDIGLWNLCCDIAAESILDSMDSEAVRVCPSDLRESWYEKLDREVSVLTAEKLYAWFCGQKRDAYLEEQLRREFSTDDHSFWERLEDEKEKPPENPDLPVQNPEDDWNEKAKRLKEDLESRGSEAADEYGALSRILRAVYRKRTDYRKWLERFSVLREETKIDPDSFDYHFYYYGLSLYGNMPLIEENEFCESRKVETLVLAIDTSASCQPALVQEFVNETVSILKSKESFFRTVDIHIVECDNQVQRCMHLKRLEDIDAWKDTFTVSGGFGTDFRPVFQWVRDMQNKGALQTLKGLLYFTDGYGIYPEEATPYETAFVFWNDADEGEIKTPDWAQRLYVEPGGKI